MIIGIDPGFTGALACLDKNNGKVMDVIDMPILRGVKTELDESAIVKFLNYIEPDLVVIERAQAMPKQGSSSTARYMCGYGILRGICVGLFLPYITVPPVTWKKKMLGSQAKGKDGSILLVNQLYPGLLPGRKKDHGRADAILIAKYGLEKK